MNTFAYANNNPLRFIDPDGLNPFYIALRFGKEGLKIVREVSKAQAKKHLRKGGDVAGSKKSMKKMQKQKGKGKPKHEKHGNGTGHWHRGDRQGGHGFTPDKLPALVWPGAGPTPGVLDDLMEEFCSQNPGAANCYGPVDEYQCL